MPILKNQRHELFAQALAKGMSATQAYMDAGYPVDAKVAGANANRLLKNAGIRARVLELQGKVAEKAEVSLEWLVNKARYLSERADELNQLSAATGALKLMAELTGHHVQRTADVSPPKATSEVDSEIGSLFELGEEEALTGAPEGTRPN